MANNIVNFQIDFGTKAGERKALALHSFLQKKFGNIDLKFNSKGPNGLGTISSNLSNFEKSLDAAAARVVAFTATTSLIYSFARALKTLTSDSINVEKQLNGIQAILQTSPQNLQKFSQGLFQIANQNSIAFDDAAKAANEFARQGLDLEKTLKATDSALKLSKISQVEVTKAVGDLTAAVNSFNSEGLDYVDVLDKIVAVDAHFAVTAGGLAEGIKRVGSVASDAGVSLDQLNGLLAAVQQTTGRSSAVIANGFKSIFVSLQDSKIQEKLEQIGVATRDSFGNFRSQFDVLDDLADKFGTLTDAQQAQITKLVAGKFQANTFTATLKVLAGETNLVTKAIETSANASGDAQKRIEILGSTTASSIQKFQNSLTQLNAAIGKTLVNPIIDNFAKSFSAVFDVASAGLNEDNFAGVGNTIGKAVLKGLTDAISGPGLVVAVTVLGKLIFKTVSELAKISKSLIDLGKVRGQSIAAEKSISNEIVKQNSLYSTQDKLLSRIESRRAIAAKNLGNLSQSPIVNPTRYTPTQPIGSPISASGNILSRKINIANVKTVDAEGFATTVPAQRPFTELNSARPILPFFTDLNQKNNPVIQQAGRRQNSSLNYVNSFFEDLNKSKGRPAFGYSTLFSNLGAGREPGVLLPFAPAPSRPGDNFNKSRETLQAFKDEQQARKNILQQLKEEEKQSKRDVFSRRLLGASFVVPLATGAFSSLLGGEQTRAGRTASNFGQAAGTGLIIAALAGGSRAGVGAGAALGLFQFLNNQSKNTLDFPRLSQSINKVIDGLDKQVVSLNAFNQAANKAEELLNSGAPLSVRLRAQSQVSNLVANIDPKLRSVLLNPNSTEEQKQLANLDFSDSIQKQQASANLSKSILNLNANEDQRSGGLFQRRFADLGEQGGIGKAIKDFFSGISGGALAQSRPTLGKDEAQSVASIFLESLGGIGNLRNNQGALAALKSGNLQKAVLSVNGRQGLEEFSSLINELNVRFKGASLQIREYVKELINQSSVTADILNRADKLRAINIPLKDIVDKIVSLRFSDIENASQNRADRFNSNITVTNSLLAASGDRVSASDLAVRQAALRTEQLQFGRSSELNSALRTALGGDIVAKIQANTSDPKQLLTVLENLSENFDIQELSKKLDNLVGVGKDSKESITKELINVRPALINAIKTANARFDVQSKEVKELLNIQLEEIKKESIVQTFGTDFLRNGGAGKFSQSLITGSAALNETPEQIKRRQDRLRNASTLGSGPNARAIAAENERRSQNALSVLTKNENFRNAINFESLSPDLQGKFRSSLFEEDKQAIFDLRKSEQGKGFIGPVQQQIDFIQSLSKGKFTSISGGQEKNIINSILSGNPQGALDVLSDPRLSNITDSSVKSGLDKLKNLIGLLVEIDKNTNTAATEEANRLNKSGGGDLSAKLSGLNAERSGLLATESQSGDLLLKTQSLVDNSNVLVSKQDEIISLLQQTVQYNEQRIKADSATVNGNVNTFAEKQFTELGVKLEKALQTLGETLSSSLSGRTTSSSNLDVSVDVSGNVRSTFNDSELIKTIQYNIAEAMRAALGSTPIFKPIQR